jgi:hypothetical protein
MYPILGLALVFFWVHLCKSLEAIMKLQMIINFEGHRAEEGVMNVFNKIVANMDVVESICLNGKGDQYASILTQVALARPPELQIWVDDLLLEDITNNFRENFGVLDE